MRNGIAAVGLGAAILFGVGAMAVAVGAVGQPSPSTAGAAMANLLADTSTPAPDSTAGPGWRGGFRGGPGWDGGMHAGPLAGLVSDGTITADQASKILTGFKAALPTDGTRPDAATLQSALKTTLDKLVADKTITADQATKVTAAFGDFSGGFRGGPGGGCGGARGMHRAGPNGAAPNANPTPSPTTGQGTGTSL